MTFELPNKKTKILVLTSSPVNLNPLQVELECKEIKRSINYTRNLDKYELIQEYATTIEDLEKLLREFQPNIIHFSGHGQKSGIYLEDSNQQSKIVDGASLLRLFNFYSDTVECVILNSCYSEKQAQYISMAIPFVIGTKSEIKDEAAINFSKTFYSSLADGNTYEESFELGYIRVSLEDKHQKEILIIYVNGEKTKYLGGKRKYERKGQTDNNIENGINHEHQKWVLVAGAGFISISLLFFMGLVLITVIFNKSIPPDTKYIITVITSFTASAGSAFLGGYARARGKFSVPFFNTPFSVGLAGGIAVFFLSLVLGNFLYLDRENSSPIVASTDSFHEYEEDYREKYQDIHLSLDENIISANVLKIDSMSYSEYKEFIILGVRNLESGHKKVESAANFYESLLKCEKYNPDNCNAEKINLVFGDEIRTFWYTYRPYIEYIRKNGYPKMGILLEKRAVLLKNK